MSETKKYLESVRELLKGHPSIEGFLLEHGKSYERKPLPNGFSYGPAKLCYRNAFSEILSETTSSLRYCEGYAYTPGLIPCPHAWIVDKEDDKVIDITWRDGGTECPFCCGLGLITNEDELLENLGEEEECSWCKGTGEVKDEHLSREGCEYFGIEFDREEVIKRTVDQGYYGILERYVADQLTKETT